MFDLEPLMMSRVFRPFADPDFRAAFEPARVAGMARWRAESVRCAGTRRDGHACMAIPQKGAAFCRVHNIGATRPPRQRAPRPSPMRVHSKLMAAAWRDSPWIGGATCILADEAEAAFQARLQAEGVDARWWSPAVVDWIKWRYVVHIRSGERTPFGRQVDQTRQRAAAQGEPPSAWLPDFTAESRLDAWHPRLTVHKPFQPANARARSRPASAEQIAQRDAELAVRAQEWHPAVGGPLDQWERRQLGLARAKDEREGRSGHRLEEVTRRAIEAWRLARAQREDARQSAEVDQLRAELAGVKDAEFKRCSLSSIG